MPKQNAPLQKFNRGMISPLGLARVDLENYPFFAEDQTNWMPRILGSMMLRPGWGYIDSTLSNAAAFHIPFVFSNSDTAILEMTDSVMRVRLSETAITRPSVSSAVTNGTFGSNITNWTDADDAGGTSSWLTGGYASLVGNGTAYARLRQQVTVGGADQGDEHALRIIIARGNVVLKVGSSAGGEQYITATTLTEGQHSIAFTPTGDFHIELAANTKYASLVDSIAVEGSGTMQIPTPWAAANLTKLRYTQSGDVVFIACDGIQQYKVNRYASRSWGVVKYLADDGPFRNLNITTTTITPTAISGDTTLTASAPVFTSSMVGGLIKIDSIGQRVEVSATAENTFSNEIEITGTERSFTIVRSGFGTATLTLQRSLGAPGTWVDVTTYTTNGTVAYDDGLDNQIAYYRIGVKTGEYTSGTIVASLEIASGSITGVARITAFSSSTSVTAHVLTDFGRTTATTDWYEGAWSSRRGFPSCVTLYESRLFWAGRDKIWGSVSDGYSSFDSATEGDSGPISRSIGEGPVDSINWLLPLSRLIVGGQGAEWSVKSTTFDEPLTPTNFNIKSPSTQGSGAVAGVKIDDRGMFVDKTLSRLYQIYYDANVFDFISDDLTKIIPEIMSGTVVRIAVQRKPDTRIHCVLSDGTVAIYVYDQAENVRCWVKATTDGLVEDVVVLPGTTEDTVYYTVNRTINGSTKRYLEKWALESECQGGTLNKQADSFLSISQASSTTISGLSHLEAETVVVWAGGLYLGTYTVSGGSITVSTAVTTAIVGLAYSATFKSTKLAYAAGLGTALVQRKKLHQLGLILHNTHHLGLQYGEDADNLDDLPGVVEDLEVVAGTVWSRKDLDLMEINSTWQTDSRLYLKATAPKPCTLLAAIVSVQTNDKG